MDSGNWPRLYRVILSGVEGQQHEFTALSFLGPHKAVAMAVEGHYAKDLGRFFGRKAWSIYGVEVVNIGSAPRNSDGTVGSGPAGTLEDRAEF